MYSTSTPTTTIEWKEWKFIWTNIKQQIILSLYSSSSLFVCHFIQCYGSLMIFIFQLRNYSTQSTMNNDDNVWWIMGWKELKRKSWDDYDKTINFVDFRLLLTKAIRFGMHSNVKWFQSSFLRCDDGRVGGIWLIFKTNLECSISRNNHPQTNTQSDCSLSVLSGMFWVDEHRNQTWIFNKVDCMLICSTGWKPPASVMSFILTNFYRGKRSWWHRNGDTRCLPNFKRTKRKRAKQEVWTSYRWSNGIFFGILSFFFVSFFYLTF